MIRRELGHGYFEALTQTYSGRVPGGADFVCYWFEKARAQIENKLSDRAGLLATNSIRGGANRRVLDRIKQTGDIFFAWSDEPWILEGAAVRISIVGFDDGTEKQRALDGMTVQVINPDLSSSVDITVASRLRENLNIAHIGTMKKGPFDISDRLAQRMLSEPPNANGHPNSDVVLPFVNGIDIVRRPRNMWIIYFDAETKIEEAALYELPFEYVKENVYPLRVGHREAVQAQKWWLLARPSPDLRKAVSSLQRYIGTARVAKHRIFVWLESHVVPDGQIVAVARHDDYSFGVLHSRPHELWSLRMGTSLGPTPRYTPSTTFETYPFPWPPGQEPVDDPRVIAIGEAAKALDDARNNWLNPADASAAELKKRTLTNLYNTNPTWLQNLHATLDRAVWTAYGWPSDETPAEVEEDVILGRLLALNLERSAGES